MPFAEMEGEGEAKLNVFKLSDVGEVEISPLSLALKENAIRLSGVPTLLGPQYRLPFQ